MKTIYSTTALILWTALFFGQAQIKYETALLDYGQVLEGSEGKREIHFTNIGSEPLIIINAVTGDGGSMATFPKEPIAPGKNGIIIFYYDTKRVGKFEKCISISSNATPASMGCAIRAIGEVVWHKTIVKTNLNEKNIGNLNFGDVDTVQFEITNIGKEKLHLSRITSPGIDLLWYQILSKDSIEKNYKYYINPRDLFYSPSETVQITALIKNVYGNIGKYEKSIALGYNSHDTLLFKITSNFIGKPDKKKIYETNSLLIYNNDKLLKIEYNLGDGKLVKEDFFDGYYLTHSKYYDFYTMEIKEEYFYKNGILINSKKYKVNSY